MGKFSAAGDSVKLLVCGESTAAGVGARTHETALAGQFARFLSLKIGKSVEWRVIGKSGITIKETIYELVPKIPDEQFDYILVALCGNEVLKLRSPRAFRRDMMRFLGIVREKIRAVVFITNRPPRLSPVLPRRKIYSRLFPDARQKYPRVPRRGKIFYFPQPDWSCRSLFSRRLFIRRKEAIRSVWKMIETLLK